MSNKIFLEDYSNIGTSTGTGTDDTIKIQEIINNCISNTEIIFSSTKTYNIKHLLITKPITINLNGCTIIASPMDKDEVIKQALFYFKGTKTYIENVGNLTQGNSTITHTKSLDNSKDIIIYDNTDIPGWDMGKSTDPLYKPHSGKYTGRGELNAIKSDDGTTIITSKPFEFNYTNANLCSVDYLNSPKIIGKGALIKEVDLGAFAGDQTDGNMPSLIQMDFCSNPIVDDINVDGWNYKVVSSTYCKNPIVKRIIAKNPFRPEIAAHGYVMQFVRCSNSKAEKNIGYGARHVVDYANSIDGYSCNNIGYDGYTSQYLTHGMASKRITSFKDSAINCKIGWGFGNGAFSADYDMEIISPILISNLPNSEGIMASSSSENLTVLDCNINTSGRAFFFNSGASNIKVIGGVVQCKDASTISESIFSRGKLSASDTVDIKPKDVAIENVDMVGKVNVTLYVDGNLRFKGNNINNTISGVDKPFWLIDGDVTNFIFKDNFIRGNSTSGARSDVIPTGTYIVDGNTISTGNPIYFKSKGGMFWCNNRFAASDYIFQNGFAQADIDSSTIDNNKPNKYDKTKVLEDKTKDLELVKYKTVGISNNATTIDATGYNFIALGNTAKTTISTITYTDVKYGTVLNIYSYNSNSTLSHLMTNFKFATPANDITFPVDGGMVTFIYYGDKFFEQSRTF